MGNPLLAIHELGQSIWLDNISRELLDSGKLASLIAEDGISGVTSNPTIFEKAIGHSDLYDRRADGGRPRRPRRARDLLPPRLRRHPGRRGPAARRPTTQADGQDGYISFELPPELARDADGSIEAAKRFTREIDRPNVFIKVPATREGVEAFRELTAAGVSVNVTLLFAVERYEEIANAWIDGLERRVAAGEPVDRLASVASFFVSRVDTKVDARLEQLGRARPAGHRRGRQRQARLSLVPADLLGPALGGAGGQGRARAAPALGLDVDQEPVLPRHALRRHADRPGHRQHDARGHDRRHARPRRRGASRSTRRSTRPRRT